PIMLWLTPTSIKHKLYLLGILNTVSITLVLSLAVWLLATFRVNGPVYERIKEREKLQAIMEPAILAITRPYQMILKLVAAASPEEMAQATARLRELESDYRQQQDFWGRSLPDGPLRKNITAESYVPADEI